MADDTVMMQQTITQTIEAQKGFDAMASSVGVVERKMAGLSGAIKGMPFVKMVIQMNAYRKSMNQTLNVTAQWRQMSDEEKEERKKQLSIMQRILIPLIAYNKIGVRMNKITAISNTLLGRFTARLFGLFSILFVMVAAFAAISIAIDGVNSPVVQLTADVPLLGDAMMGLVIVLTGEDGEGGLKAALDVVAASLLVFIAVWAIASAPIAILVAAIVLAIGIFKVVKNETESTFAAILAGGAALMVGLIPMLLFVKDGVFAVIGVTKMAVAGIMAGFALILAGLAAAWAVATGWGSDLQALVLTIIGYVALVVGIVLVAGATIAGAPAWIVAAIIAAIVFGIAWIWRKRDELVAMGKEMWNMITSLPENLKTVFNAIRNDIEFTLGKLKEDFEGIIDSVITTIKNTPGSIWTKLKAGLRELALQLGQWYNDTIAGFIPEFTVPEDIPVIGGKSFGPLPPKIPMLAKGGIVTRPTLAMIGEAGPEAVVPLSKGGGMGTFNINIDVSGVTDRTDKRALAMQISDEIQKEMRRYGRGTTRRAI